MEWFPSFVTTRKEEGVNPEGTAVIELNVHTGKVKSVIFVKEKSFTPEVTFKNLHFDEIIKWVENETGLTYKEHFQLIKKEKKKLQFQASIDGVIVSPPGHIEFKWDEEGKLVMFSIIGEFPSSKNVREESYSLTLKDIEPLAKEQLKLIEFPSDELKKLVPVYVIEEIYVTNDGTSTISFEFIANNGDYLVINKKIEWFLPSQQTFDRMEINLQETVTIQQALSKQPHPNVLPISKEEKNQCIAVVEEFLRQEFPDDSGKWMLKTLHRERGYIQATLRKTKQDYRAFQRKLLVMIDPVTFQALNYIDNKTFLEFFNNYAPSDPFEMNKDQAYEQLKEFIELKPRYVYDKKKKQFILCGKLDCQYGVNASTGEVIALNTI